MKDETAEQNNNGKIKT